MLAFASPTPDATPVWLVSVENWPTVKSTIGAAAAAFAERCGFQPKAGRMQLLPGDAGALAGVLFGVDEANAPTRDPFGPGKLATSLPEGVYRFADPPEGADLAALGFLLALYRYDRFKTNKAPLPQLVAPEAIDAIRIQRIAEAIAFGRDLVNAPANVLGPDALEQEVVKLAEHFDARIAIVRGEELIAANFPLIHAVGRAGAEEPRIVDFTWGREDAPKVAIIGKGVTFDTGGLDIKPASGMELMKKDMGGAATALDARATDHGGRARSPLKDRDPDRRECDRGAGDASGRCDCQPQGDFGRGRQHRRRRADDPRRRARARR